LISLDVLIWDGQIVPISYYVGGTCGNVMMILSHMGWDAYPIARHHDNRVGARGSFPMLLPHCFVTY
ncbi:MAG: hypothetical protein J6I61_00210, partial [Prevotella sp.]|nr:hypothetical protein [Prevotella sp.]